MSIYFIEKCRACDSPNKYADLFHKNNHLLLSHFKALVHNAYKFEISEEDGISRWLCQSCVEKVDCFILFIEVCKATRSKYEPIRDDNKDGLLLKDHADPLNSVLEELQEETCEDTIFDNEHESDEGSVEMVLINSQPENLEVKEKFLENEALEAFDSSRTDFKCNVCSKVYTKRSNLSRHIQTAHKNKRFACSECPKSFTQSSTLSDHIKKKHSLPHLELSKQVFECDVCQHSTNSKLEMQRHLNSHLSNSKLFHCKICPDKAYSHSNNLSRHMAAFHLNKKHYCDDCNNCFTQRGSLNEHRRNMHQNPLNEAKFKCESCHKVLNTLKMYQQHLKRHDGNLVKEGNQPTHVKPIKMKPIVVDGVPKKKYRRLCPWCGKFYKHLEEHMMLHKGEKIHKCQYCNKSFTFKTTLTAHLRIHTGSRPYQCTLCPKSFRVSHHLKEHQSTHSNTKEFVCLICEKSFNSKLTLYKHSKIHQSSLTTTQAAVQTQNIVEIPPDVQYTFYSTFEN